MSLGLKGPKCGWLGGLRSDGGQRVSAQGLQQTGVIWRHWRALGSSYCQGMIKRSRGEEGGGEESDVKSSLGMHKPWVALEWGVQ